MTTFACFAPRLQQAIVARLGWSSLRPVQEEAGEATYLIDTLELPDLEPLGQLLANGETTKLIHYAPFEREVLGRQGFVLDAVVDIREASIRLRRTASGHSLREVCARELGVELDKRE